MTQRDSDGKQPATDEAARHARGAKVFAVFDVLIKAAVVTVVVLGIMAVIIALSGVDMARADEHEIFRFGMYAAPVIIVGYLLIDYLLARRRAIQTADAAARSEATNVRNEFALSVGPEADRRAAQAAAAANAADKARPKRGYAVEMMALVFVAGGGAAFWHDHINHEIPNAMAVPAKFVSAKCVDQVTRRIGGTVGPHMSIGYEFPSLSTSVRDSGMKCLLDNCEPEKKPPQYMDTEYKQVFYASLPECMAALSAVLAAKAPVAVWIGDKDPNASMRARFTPEREKTPYFLLWFPSVVAAIILLISGFARTPGALGG